MPTLIQLSEAELSATGVVTKPIQRFGREFNLYLQPTGIIDPSTGVDLLATLIAVDGYSAERDGAFDEVRLDLNFGPEVLKHLDELYQAIIAAEGSN